MDAQPAENGHCYVPHQGLDLSFLSTKFWLSLFLDMMIDWREGERVRAHNRTVAAQWLI